MSPSPSMDEDRYALEHLPHPESVEASCMRNATGFVSKIVVAKTRLAEAAAGEVEFVRINVAGNDRDPAGQTQLWWWPDWRTAEDLPASGTLRLAH